MKRALYIVIPVFAAGLILSFLIKPALVRITENAVGKLFPGSTVNVGGCRLNLLSGLTFFDVSVRKGQGYDVKIREVNILYNLPSLMSKKFLKIRVADATARINMPKRHLLNAAPIPAAAPTVKSGKFSVGLIELSNINVKFTSRELEGEGVISAEFDLAKGLLNYCDMNIPRIQTRDFLAEGAVLKIGPGQNSGKIYIKKVGFNKLSGNGIKGNVNIKGNTMFLGLTGANTLSGGIKGTVSLSLAADRAIEYTADLQAVNLDIETFTKDFEIDRKFQMTGKLGGRLSLKGKGLDITVFDGNLSAISPGGALTISDTRFLENMAAKSGQSLDLLVEGFKYYRYNNAAVKLDIDQGNLVLKMSLSGDAGERSLHVVVHDFKLRRWL